MITTGQPRGCIRNHMSRLKMHLASIVQAWDLDAMADNDPGNFVHEQLRGNAACLH